MDMLAEAERARLRRLWVEHCKRQEALTREWVEWFVHRQGPQPEMVPWPDELRGLTCGAKTRKGTPCKRKDLYRNGRCKLHGGLSTGPRTEEGKAKVALNGRCPKLRSRRDEGGGLSKEFENSVNTIDSIDTLS